jgi:predicted lipoprotein with Yx(FWY)xxD motif
MKNVTFFFLLLAATLLIAGCAQQQQAQAPPAATAAPAAPAPTTLQPAYTIMATPGALGTTLTDARGKTLYYFANDIPASGASSCNGQCAAIWPVFSTDTVKVPAPLDPADFGSITRADGTKQTTYYGWPLYYYAPDTNPGDVGGENFLKVWFVIKPDESVLIAHNAALGLYLTDTAGKTLYVFAKDSAGTSTCTGACLAKWPAFGASPVTAPSSLTPTDFSTVSRADGVNQTAWMGMPLYYYSGDQKPGDANGQGFNGVWYAANASGIVPVTTTMPTTAPTVSTTLMSSGSGGY